jgi:hypothetical protein
VRSTLVKSGWKLARCGLGHKRESENAHTLDLTAGGSAGILRRFPRRRSERKHDTTSSDSVNSGNHLSVLLAAGLFPRRHPPAAVSALAAPHDAVAPCGAGVDHAEVATAAIAAGKAAIVATRNC